DDYCDPGHLFEIDPRTGVVVRSTDALHTKTADPIHHGNRLYVADQCTDVLQVIDLDSLEVIDTLPAVKAVDLAITPDEQQIFTSQAFQLPTRNSDRSTDWHGSVTRLDRVSRALETIPVAENATGPLAITPDGGLAYVGVGSALAVLDTA